MDRRLIAILLEDFYTVNILSDDYKFSPKGKEYGYFVPPETDLEGYLEFTKESMPLNDYTEVFGLHDNAEISSALREKHALLNTVLGLLPRTVEPGQKQPEDIIKEKCEEILKQLPEQFDLIEVTKKHPVKYNESMNTVLQQELMRFNKLLNLIRSSLINLEKAIEGFLVMSKELQQVFDNLFDNSVPTLWQKVSGSIPLV